jgi:two-component system alkaline phosphatase synthesis response regulator PhoP
LLSNHQLKVLVVDDEPDIRESLTLRLESEGFTVVTAEDGKQAYDLAQAVLPDCIILDLDLPVLDGLDTLKHLRGDPQTSDIPVLVLTASTSSVDKLATRNFGVEGYAIKPFDHKVLVEQIRNTCQALALT